MSDHGPDAPWAGNPNITRKEACEAKRAGKELPITPAIAEAAASMVLAHVPKEEIAEKLGYDASDANKLMKAPEVNTELRKQLRAIGIDHTYYAKKFKEGMEAEVVVTAKFEGKITDEKSYPDFKVRHAYLETALETEDEFPARRRDRGTDAPRAVIKLDAKYAQVFFGDSGGRPVVEIQTGSDVPAGHALPEADHCD